MTRKTGLLVSAAFALAWGVICAMNNVFVLDGIIHALIVIVPCGLIGYATREYVDRFGEE